MRVLYSLGIRLYVLAIHLAAFFNRSAAAWVKGRKNQPEFSGDKTDSWIWFHAASLGEFEQGRPVIEQFKTDFPSYKILITFFSPSGYNVRKNYLIADFITYLPPDLNVSMTKFIAQFNLKLVVFVKYEYWYNLLNVLKINDIPYFFISAIYRPSQIFFKPYGRWFREHLEASSHIFCQDIDSVQLLKNIGIERVSLSGDTRFDRVIAAISEHKNIDFVKAFSSESQVVVVGSSWPEDESLIATIIRKSSLNYKWILVPHHVDESHISQIITLFEGHKILRFSQVKPQFKAEDFQILVIDSIGLLLHLYRYATIAWVGGGFGAGIHNILEPAAYSKPIIIGPRYQKFKEAKDLVRLGGVFPVSALDEAVSVLEKMQNDAVFFEKSSKISGDYVYENQGATEHIMAFFRNYNLKNS
ncbi:MAG: 3-deoxy-D-manno-octulosonic acid transferase [Bacteroidales bacterium]|nr:3-deoxy-D-manno-octulosonic acid transferase [Bacteroidales bacterium]